MKPSTTSATPSIVDPADLAALSAWRRSGPDRYFAISNRPCSSRRRTIVLTLSELRSDGARHEARFGSVREALEAIAADSIRWRFVRPIPAEPVDPHQARVLRRLSCQRLKTPLA